MDEEEKELTIALSRINALYARWYEGRGVSQARQQVVLALAAQPGISQKGMCDSYLMPKQTVSKEIRLLESEGCLVLERDEDDGRARRIRVTERGEDYIAEVLSPYLELEARVRDGMGADGYAALIEGLGRYADALESAVRDEKEGS